VESWKPLLLPWLLGAVALWITFDSLRSQCYWVKGKSLDWPWYYKVPKDSSPISYWFAVVTTGLMGIGCFLAPLFLTRH
jgi:hypothetical protein